MAITLPIIIVTGIGIFCGVLLSVADKYMAVPVDERVSQVRELLPGANCGACGLAGCDEYAEQLVNEGAKTNLCTPGGAETAQKISEFLGSDFQDVIPMTAMVRCSGTYRHTQYSMDYQGPKTCEACNYLYQGRGSCSHGCMGFGDCVLACQYDAIDIVDGIAKVDKSLCTGCGMCAKACPKSLITMIPSASEVYVACSSTDRGAVTRKVCSAGCIGCRLCVKACEFDAIAVTDNLAVIDPEKCTNCGECVKVCPTKVIRVDQGQPQIDVANAG